MPISEELKRQLAVGTEKYNSIKNAIIARLKLSQDAMSERYLQMGKNEEIFQAYVPTRAIDLSRKQNKDVSGEHDYVTIEIPYSYAILMTAHTYFTSVFLSRNPIFQFTGRHGEGEMQVQAVEALVDYMMSVGKNIVPLYIWLLDPGKYGFGVIGHYWDRDYVRTRRYVEEIPKFLGVPIPGAKPRKVALVEDVLAYQGVRLFNVRPQDFFPDPRVALWNFQQGEFVGRYVEISWHEVVKRAQEGRYFNIDAAYQAARDMHGQGTGITRDQGSSRVTTLPNTNDRVAGYDIPVGFIKAHEVIVRLFPNQWGLDTQNDRCELWVFTISTEGVLFGVEPLGDYASSFPYEVLPSEPDGYSLFTPSMLERSKPLNDVMSWLINQHFYNVRAALNNQFVFDPMMISVKDLERDGPGKLIRLKPQAYGKDVRSMIMQLPVADVTRSHIADLNVVAEFIQRALGVNDNVMGSINPGGRKTATEIRSSTSFSISRLKTVCEFFSAQGFSPLGQRIVQSAQSNLDREIKVRIVGDTATFAPGFVEVTPETIAGFYDFVPVDGTMPVDRYAQTQLWQVLMTNVVRNFPQILQQYDVTRIFAWIAGIAGLKNINQFKLQIVPDSTAMNAAAAGNIVPLKAAQQELGRPEEPQQLMGMGATG